MAGRKKSKSMEAAGAQAMDVDAVIMKSMEVCDGFVRSLPEKVEAEAVMLAAIYLMGKMVAKGYATREAASILFDGFDGTVEFMGRMFESGPDGNGGGDGQCR